MRGLSVVKNNSDRHQTKNATSLAIPVTTMNDDSASSDGSAAAGPALPAGVLKTRTAWAGDELEMAHTRRTIAANTGSDAKTSSQHAAVDISQFQNTIVGSGYQAKHVIRQRGVSGSDGMYIRDMTGGNGVSSARDALHEESYRASSDSRGTDREPPSTSKRAKLSDATSSSKKRHSTKKENPADRYLKCKGVRDFRLEIERLLSSA